MANQAPAHAHKRELAVPQQSEALVVPKQSKVRVARRKILPRQRLMGWPRADKGPLAATAAVAIRKWQPVVTGTRILGALDAMVFCSPGSPGVAALVVRAT